jgi:cytochrome c biogenesis protein ResB
MHHDEDAYGAIFLSYERRQSTGLLIKENPGGSLIWFGIIGMSIGILLVFWVVRRRYWVAIDRVGDDGVRLTIGCAQKREDSDADAQLNELAGWLSAGINPSNV